MVIVVTLELEKKAEKNNYTIWPLKRNGNMLTRNIQQNTWRRMKWNRKKGKENKAQKLNALLTLRTLRCKTTGCQTSWETPSNHLFWAPGIFDGAACLPFPLGCPISLTVQIMSLFNGVSVLWLARCPIHLHWMLITLFNTHRDLLKFKWLLKFMQRVYI